MPFTAILTYSLIEFLKAFIPRESKFRSALPLISILIGAIFGSIFYFSFPEHVLSKEFPQAAVAGAVSGLAATGYYQVTKMFK